MVTRSTVAVVVLLAAQVSQGHAQSTGRFQLVRSVSGGKGTPDGTRFIMDDPRSVFQAGKDRQVMVSFEWLGPAGRHHCEGAWKDPTGKTVFTSEADVVARGTRFTVYWGLSLSDSVPTGTWVIEARIDGEPAGAHSFQLQKELGAAAEKPPKRSLTVAELYQRGLAETLTIVALDGAGAQIGTASGFFVAPNLVNTSFAGINAARSVRVLTPDKRRMETSEVLSWNKRDDWAVLRLAGAAEEATPRGGDPLKVGDRCYFLEAQGESGRVIVETTVIGQSGDEFTLADGGHGTSNGGPVFNEYGEAVAVLAGSGILGATELDVAALGGRVQLRGARARSLTVAPDAEATTKSLQEVEQLGFFVRPIARTAHFVSGVLGTEVDRKGPVPMALNQKVLFSHSDGKCVVFVTWVPAQKQDTTIQIELFNEDNRRLLASEARKARLRSSEAFVQYWEIPLAPLRPGIHRFDVVLGQEPVWRTFFRLTD
jgi:hypothetical protein